MAAQENKELITLGDFNLNKFSWELHPSEMNEYETAQSPLVKSLHDKILSKGFTVINSAQTKEKISPQDKTSCLDLIITNRKDKILMHDTISPTFSDHFLIIMKRQSKPIQVPKQFMKLRCFKNFNKTNYQDNIINHPNYINLFYENDPNTISNGIQKLIQESLDRLAPIRRIQLTKQNISQISKEAREMLAIRDSKFEEYKITKNMDIFREYKNLKNETNKKIYKERFDKKK